MKKRLFVVAAATVLGLLTLAATGHAVVVLSNLGAPQQGLFCLDPSHYQADAFTTGSSGTYVLNSVTYTFFDGNGTATVYLYGDNGGQPGSALATIGSATINGSGNTENYTITPSSTISLLPHTTYWLVTEGTSFSSCSQEVTSSAHEPTGSFTYSGKQYSTNSGSTWSSTINVSVFSVDATVPTVEVPTLGGWELAAMALLLLGTAIYWLRR